MKTTSSLFSLSLALAFIPGAASAAVINVNLLRTGSFTTVTNPGYGLWNQGSETWNATSAASANDLVDSDGDATTVDFTIVATGGTGNNSNTGFGPDDLTFQGRYSSNDSINTLTLTMSGLLTNQAYELLVYHAANNPNEIETANGVAPSNFTGSTTTTGGATYVDGFDSVDKVGTHFYYYSSVSSGLSGEIVVVADGANFETFTGFQLRAIPEPGVSLLGGLGMLALLRRRR